MRLLKFPDQISLVFHPSSVSVEYRQRPSLPDPSPCWTLQAKNRFRFRFSLSLLHTLPPLVSTQIKSAVAADSLFPSVP
ncbi:unnamed protein product [Linum trigynum]|uniref:Uncharacterized protein n=1 Tax=Linum trigynum TaxID=586398 RepID=A0AAV2GU66_9ROSI